MSFFKAGGGGVRGYDFIMWFVTRGKDVGFYVTIYIHNLCLHHMTWYSKSSPPRWFTPITNTLIHTLTQAMSGFTHPLYPVLLKFFLKFRRPSRDG